MQMKGKTKSDSNTIAW